MDKFINWFQMNDDFIYEYRSDSAVTTEVQVFL